MARNTVDNISIRALQRTEIQTPFIQPFLYCRESSSVIKLLMAGLLMALKLYSLFTNINYYFIVFKDEWYSFGG